MSGQLKSEWNSLQLVHPDVTLAGEVRVAFELCARVLTARFEVRGRPIHVNPALAQGQSHWGLWDWDVVELFLGASSSPTYYEFQVSPLNQYFELEVFEPRKRFNRDFKSGFIYKAAQVSEAAWNAQLDIPLDRLGWDGSPDSLRGNAFAILNKTYWSLHLPKQDKPDFHLPQYFRRLI